MLKSCHMFPCQYNSRIVWDPKLNPLCLIEVFNYSEMLFSLDSRLQYATVPFFRSGASAIDLSEILVRQINHTFRATLFHTV